ncbi:MAG: response regulator [Candidatus Omnitrophica bacterium]|nr:response regulator [Candidatus Omnitrophota bacterium]
MRNRPKVLIIDDSEADRILLHEAIKKAGLEVEVQTARSGEEGVKKANELRPEAIIVLDTLMPGMNGFEACKKIKEMDQDSKVILCTGVVDAVDAAKARAAGADDYCVKTDDYEAVVGAIKSLITS